MQTRLRTGSLPREKSVDTEERRSSIDDLDMEFGMAEAGGRGKTVAHLMAGLKDNNEDAPLPPKGMTTRRKSAPSRAIPVPQAPPEPAQAPLTSSHESSGSGFISGIMNNQGGGTAATTLSHTPPTATGTSYEAQHFGKRPRSGSVSGRLRSASDLEDKGIIDRNQKAILKDLIISGDEELQAALDKYERGDSEPLESMIRSGELMSRHAADIDLLGDLDLDFLNVDDHFVDIGPSLEQPPPPAPPQSSMALQPPPALPSKDALHHLTAATTQTSPTMVSLSTHEDEAIGGLDLQDTRFRSNSLAYGNLDQAVAADGSAVTYGWTDPPDFPQTREGRVESIGGLSYASAGGVAPPPAIGGIAESLAQYAAKAKDESTTKPLTKAQLAEQKRRERQLKKEQKEREKAEKKEQRERARAEKKEREAREKQVRKEKKAAAVKAKQQKEKERQQVEQQDVEPKETPSGLGRPRSMSDPNLTSSIDSFGLLSVDRPDGWVGAYSPESRKMRIERFMAKRNHRVWTKKVKYDVRKNFADSRLRVKGRFVKKEDELLMRDLMSLT